jgi:hypothetical protein
MIRLASFLLAVALVSPLHADSTLAPRRIYAQELVNQTLAMHPDLLVVAMHVTPPGARDNVIIASNIGRIGKKADAEDLKVIESGETLAKVNKNGDRFEVELLLHDIARKPVGALAIVFPYRAGDDEGQFVQRAEMIRDELGKQIASVVNLMQPYPANR